METQEVTQEARNIAAAAILSAEGYGDNPNPLEPTTYDECLYDVGRNHGPEYLILTDEEADERTAEYVADSLWAFQAWFLASYMPEGIDADEIDAIRGDRCEDANPAMLALVQAGPYTLEDLVGEAIQADGRGHFLAGYDGSEIEGPKIDGTYWYAYRVN